MAKNPARQDVLRFLGLSLGGAKSDRTSVTVVDYYKKQKKAFVIDIFEAIGSEAITLDDHKEEFTADQVLLEIIAEHHPGIGMLATDAPLTLPPCLLECDSGCHGYHKCQKSEVKWMNKQYRVAKEKNPKLKHFTPYTQRPVEMYFKYRNQDMELLKDETLGSNLAPQAARMQYLKRHIDKKIKLIEVWPRLSIYYAQKALKIRKFEFLDYRNIENGISARSHVLERIIQHSGLFIYERDLIKLTHHLTSFDSMICAWVALLRAQDKVMHFKADLPLDSGWIDVPDL